MKTFPLSCLLAACVTAAAGAYASDSLPVAITPDLLDQLVAEAQGQSPALQAADARLQAANSALSGVRTWADPTASFGVWAPGSGGFANSAQGNLIYGLDQKLPLHGRPQLMRQAAAAAADRERFASDSTALRLRRDLEVGLIALALAGREAGLAREDLSWLDATVSTVDHRYRVGQASQVDWLKAQTARAMAGDDLITKQEELEHRAFSVNRLLNRDLHTAWPNLAVPPLQPALYYTPQLVEAALASEPELRVARQESVSAQAEADLTRRSRLPDVSVGLQAWQYSGDGALKQAMATVSFSVPWLNRGKYDDDWRRDQARKRASELDAEDDALSVREELHHHVVDLAAARRQAVLYRDQLIPLTEQTLASAQSAWEHGLGSFQDILDAHRLLVADRTGQVEALSQQGSMLAEIRLLTGVRGTSALFALAGTEPSSHASHLLSSTP
ncbi:MAG TPA: TolC family protein [Opitutaceae bacterium]|jgi:outer membrane protein TolC|nr:TolC family protein [Opitutaceae bacterium]